MFGIKKVGRNVIVGQVGLKTHVFWGFLKNKKLKFAKKKKTAEERNAIIYEFS